MDVGVEFKFGLIGFRVVSFGVVCCGVKLVLV